MTFVRRRFGGLSERVEAADVVKVRAAHAYRSEYWSVDELLAKP